jgi:diguanylate cyclase (GGDEF)-like protein
MPFHWSMHQLTEYLVRVSQPRDEEVAVRVALEEAMEALNCELGLVCVDGGLEVQLGFGRQEVPGAFRGPVRDNEVVEIPGIGAAILARSAFGEDGADRTGCKGSMVVARLDQEFGAEELQLLHGMALALGLVLHNLATLRAERARHLLVETLLAIQKAISARCPLNELLDAITEGAWELLGGCPVALLLGDPSTPGLLRPHSLARYPGFGEEALASARLALAPAAPAAPAAPISDAPNAALTGNAAPISDAPNAAARGASAGNDGRPAEAPRMFCAPVVVSGETAGCLIAEVWHAGSRRNDQGELLSAFAQQVSLALTDARTVDAVRKASRDAVTGLSNRALFLQRLEQERRLALESDQPLTVLFVDLDRFKAVNDTLGHGAGDELLAEVGRRIKRCARPLDLVARLGGDEFAVALCGAGVETGRAVAARIVRTLGRPLVVAKREVLIGASVGIAGFERTHEDAAALVGDADIAMYRAKRSGYRAKRSGRGRWVVFERHMQEEIADKLNLVAELQHLASSGQLWLAYQPILDLSSLRPQGAEALMRWSHPTRGLVPPLVFVPLTEETDTIVELGAHVANRALSEIATLGREGARLRLSLNISPRQLVDDSLREVISSALGSTGFPPELLTLEITESLLIEDPDLARVRLSALKELGLSLAIDDFGTGYSSLSYLRQFPVDQVKIDRSFVAGLRENALDDVAIARSIIELCQRLRVETVAEGIETEEQLKLLSELGCDLGQGFLFSPPMPMCDWPAWLGAARSSLVSAGTR